MQQLIGCATCAVLGGDAARKDGLVSLSGYVSRLYFCGFGGSDGQWNL